MLFVPFRLLSLIAAINLFACQEVFETPSVETNTPSVNIPEAVAASYQLTYTVDPVAGKVELEAPDRSLAAIVSRQLNLDVDIVGLTQADGVASFNVDFKNNGDELKDLATNGVVGGGRSMVSPTTKTSLGSLASGERKALPFKINNSSGQAFTFTLYVWGALEVSGNSNGGAGTGSPTPSPSVTLAPSASPSASASPTSSPSTSPTASPSTSPSPVTTSTPAPAGTVTNPGPMVVRGRVLLNGRPGANVSLTVIGRGIGSYTVRTDSTGTYNLAVTKPGTYYGYYYNDSDRNKIGYWRSRDQVVSNTTGAAIPTIDFYQKGMLNTPLPGTTNTIPISFAWNAQTQVVNNYRFRIHSRGGPAPEVLFMSQGLPGTATSFAWNGQGFKTAIAPNISYFWGFTWDAGVYGEGGALFQPIKIVR
jgi:hypothetical protein